MAGAVLVSASLAARQSPPAQTPPPCSPIGTACAEFDAAGLVFLGRVTDASPPIEDNPIGPLRPQTVTFDVIESFKGAAGNAALTFDPAEPGARLFSSGETVLVYARRRGDRGYWFAGCSRTRRVTPEDPELATLRQLAKVRPSSIEKMRLVYGIGEKKLADLGQQFLQIVLEHCRLHEVPLDQDPGLPQTRAGAAPLRRGSRDESDDRAARVVSPKMPDAQKCLALTLFEQRASIDEVVERTQRAKSTVSNYLAEFILETVPVDIEAWVPRKTYDRVVAAVAEVGSDWLKPIFVKLEESVPYEEIRLVIAHRRAIAERDKLA